MIWCIQIKDVGALGPRIFKLYNTKNKEIKEIEERNLISLVKDGKIVNLKYTDKIESSMGLLDKITNKSCMLVLGKYSDNRIKVVDSSGQEQILSFADFEQLYRFMPTQNAKVSHGTVMGINWSIPLLEEEDYLFCNIGWYDWHDFILDYGHSKTELKLRLTSKFIKLKLEYSDNLNQKISDFVEHTNMVMVNNIIKFDTFENLLSFLSSLQKYLQVPAVVNFKFIANSSGWNPDDWDLLDFYELLYGKENYNYSTNTANLFVSQSKEIIDYLTPLCKGFNLSLTSSPYMTLSELTSSVKFNSFELQHDFSSKPIFYLSIPYVEPPSFFSGLKSWLRS